MHNNVLMLEEKKMFTKEYEQGYEDFNNGIDVCQYEEGSSEESEWFKGWEQSANEAAEYMSS